MAKIRYTIVVELDFDPENYDGENVTLEDVVKVEQASIEEGLLNAPELLSFYDHTITVEAVHG